MNLIFKIIIIVIFSTIVNARNKGETEISTENGIEVFQNEKYYLLKKNVIIKSDNFSLNADNVKINFNKDMYDIVEIDAKGEVMFDSITFNSKGSGERLNLKVKLEEIKINGIDSILSTDDVEMFSDGYIKVNNLNGKFSIKGQNSKLINEGIYIEGETIDGIFSNINNGKEIKSLNISDNSISYVRNQDSEMFAKKINFNNNTSIIELIDDVTIIRDGEKITGDYGTLDTKNNSYKIKSNNKSKVKAIIKNNE